MIRTIIISAGLVLAAPGFAAAQEEHANHGEDHAAHEHGDAHDHGDHHDHDAMHEDKTERATAPGLAATPDIVAALEKGGDAALVEVLGVVCDFCATAMNKTFGKREEVAAVYVDLDEKTLSIVFEKGASLDDETIDKLVTKAGYRVAAIHRGADIRKGMDSAADPS